MQLKDRVSEPKKETPLGFAPPKAQAERRWRSRMWTEVSVEVRSGGNCPQVRTLHQTSFLISSSHFSSNLISFSKSQLLGGFISPSPTFYLLSLYLFSFTPNSPTTVSPWLFFPISTYLHPITPFLHLLLPPFPLNL